MSEYIVVSPAYGKDYKNKSDAVQAWRAGQDFILESLGGTGRYCSNRDFKAGINVEIRFNRKEDLVIIKN